MGKLSSLHFPKIRRYAVRRVRLRTVIQLIVGVAILLWLLQIANIGDTFSSILKVNVLNIVAAAGLFITASTLVGLALYVPLRHANPNASIPKVIMASYGGQLLSDVTPARSGYFITPILVNQLAGIPVDQGMAAVLATGVVNAFVKAVICLVGLGYFVSFLPLPAAILDSVIVGIVVLLVAGTFLLLLMYVKRLSKLVAKIEKLPMIGKSLHGFTQMFTNVQKEGVKIKRSLIVVTLLVLTSLLLNAVALFLVFNGLWQTSLTILDFFLVASFASVLTYVPITIAGLGVQEAGYVVLLSLLLGLPATTVDPRLLAFAFIARILFTGTDIIAIGPLLRVGFKKDVVATPQPDAFLE
jgi:uncharacterized membrane protein YbhN (UPF0104 family)